MASNESNDVSWTWFLGTELQIQITGSNMCDVIDARLVKVLTCSVITGLDSKYCQGYLVMLELSFKHG